MTKFGRSATSLCLCCAALAFAPAALAQAPAPIGEQIAKVYGLDGWDQIEAIRYTFNAQLRGFQVSRSWVWQPKTGDISYEGKAKDGSPVKLTYNQNHLADAPANVRDEIDPAFVNDKYNLLFPLQSYWDGVEAKDFGQKKLPLAQGTAQDVVVDYAPGGDRWDLYVGSGNHIEEFGFHRGGPRKPSVVYMTWSGVKKASPLLLATDRRGTADDKPAHVFFTNIAVKLTGSDAWVEAK
jgi:hypothetical protein